MIAEYRLRYGGAASLMILLVDRLSSLPAGLVVIIHLRFLLCSHEHLKLGPPLDQLDVAAAARAARHRRGRHRSPRTRPALRPASRPASRPANVGPEREGHRVAAEVGLELCGDVDVGRLPGGVLDDEEQLGDDLDDVAGLEDKVALPAGVGLVRGEAARDGVAAGARTRAPPTQLALELAGGARLED